MDGLYNFTEPEPKLSLFTNLDMFKITLIQ